METRITRIFLHPLKSAAPQEVAAARVGPLGLRGDRRWMVVDGSGAPVTQREAPALARVRPAPPEGPAAEPGGAEWGTFGSALLLRAPGRRPCRVEAPGEEVPEVRTELWGAAVRGRDAGDGVAAWLGALVGRPCRLLHLPDGWGRPPAAGWGEGEDGKEPRAAPGPASAGGDAGPGSATAFTDGYPFHFFSEASLEGLNRRLEAPVSAERFRPSFVVDAPAPHAEDAWRRLRVGELELRVVKPCPRCSVPALDPETGRRGPEPTRTLAGYRRYGGKVYFGQNAVHLGGGRIAVGDRVRVLERGAPRPPRGQEG